MAFGPMQLLVLGFDGAEFTGEIAAELKRLREHDVVRLVDALLVTKDESGRVTTMETTDLSHEESEELGALVGALIGYGAEGEEGAEVGALAGAAAAENIAQPLHEDVWYIADTIPRGTTAIVAILEHRWALGLREAVERAHGHALAEAWLHPSDLVRVGEELSKAGAER
ncbi:MAG TPA: DUF6325 family protein [Solirubrobacteraceae bacterium]|jgi:uncharacterized membrane protein